MQKILPLKKPLPMHLLTLFFLLEKETLKERNQIQSFIKEDATNTFYSSKRILS